MSSLLLMALLFVPGAASVEMPRLTPLPCAEGVMAPVDLCGTWRFDPAPGDGFWAADAAESGSAADISVPGEWVMQGFTVEKDKAAGYRRTFRVPDEWKGFRVKLRCDAVYSDATIWVNGKEVGRHEGGFTPFEFDVTDAVQPGGDNVIAIAVKGESLADTLASATQYAAHPLGGITRKIYLFAVHPVHVASLRTTTTFDETFTDATLRVAVAIANESPIASEPIAASMDLTIHGRRVVASGSETLNVPEISAGETREVTFEMQVKAAEKWDAEHPNLYGIGLVLNAGGKELEGLTQNVGFRQVEVRGDQLFVNGSPVKLHGICRHEVHPLLGRSLTPELWRKDARMFREANINYIRTSHYPPAEEFIEACDELGLFVEEEAPVCWVGHGANAAWKERDPEASENGELIVRQTMEMIARDRNHPSVILWSLANESQWNPNFERSLESVHNIDPTRPTSFHDQAWGAYNNHSSKADVAVYHYPLPSQAAKPDDNGRPMLFGEYCHLNAYNRREIVTDPGVRDAWGRAIAPMWDAMYAAKGCLGGAIWSGIDDIFLLPDGRQVGYGSWGPLDGWRRPKPEYWHVKKAYSPVRISGDSVKTPIVIRVENRYDFTNLSEVPCEWEIGEEKGTASCDAPPHSTGEIRIAPAQNELEGKILKLAFRDPRGFVCDEYSLRIGDAPRDVVEASTPSNSLEAKESAEAYSISGDGIEWNIARGSGRITSAARDGAQIVIGGPELMLLPMLGGSCATEHSADIAPFNDTCTQWNARKVSVYSKDGAREVRVEGSYAEADGSYTLRFFDKGVVEVSYRYEVKAKTDPRQIGMVVTLPRAFDVLRWRRHAQWNAYPHDHIGRPEGAVKARAAAAPEKEDLRTEPALSWAFDESPLGSNEFRSSKEHILYAGLSDTNRDQLRVDSDGRHTIRAWLDGDSVKLLVAFYSNGGGEPFVSSHFESERMPLKAGDVIEDSFRLQLTHLEKKKPEDR